MACLGNEPNLYSNFIRRVLKLTAPLKSKNSGVVNLKLIDLQFAKNSFHILV